MKGGFFCVIIKTIMNRKFLTTNKSLVHGFLLLMFLGCFFVVNLVDAYLDFEANEDIVEASAATQWFATQVNFGGGGSPEKHFLGFTNLSKIRQTGEITKFSIYFDSKPAALQTFIIELWRADGSNYDRIYYTDNILSEITAGQDNEIILPSSWNAQVGDFIGYGYTSTEDPGNFLISYDTVYQLPFFILSTESTLSVEENISVINDQNYNWSNKTKNVNYVPIKAYMRAPVVASTGDSISTFVGGKFASFFNGVFGTEFNTTYTSIVAENYGYSYQNMGISGSIIKSPNLVFSITDRFEADVISLHPKLVILEGGINDINASTTKEQFLEGYESMLELCVDNEIVSVVILMGPAKSGSVSDSNMINRDDWNSALRDLADNYNAIIVNPDDYIGENRASGPEGNKWDLKDDCSYDGIHTSVIGSAQIAQAIIDAIEADEPIIDASSISGTYLASQLITLTTNKDATCKYSTTSGTSYDSMEGSFTTTGEMSHVKALTGFTGGVKNIYVRCQDSNHNTTSNQTAVIFTVDVLFFTNDVFSEKTNYDQIEADWGGATVKKWDYDSDGECSIISEDYSKTDSDSMYQENRDHQDKYICLYAEGLLGNKMTLVSENKINISKELEIDNAKYSSTKNTVTVKWETNNDADSKVKYGIRNGHLDQKETDDDEENNHKIILKDLNFNTTYYFRIYSEDEYGNEEKTKVYSIITKKNYLNLSSSAVIPENIISEEESSLSSKREYQSFDSLKTDPSSEEEKTVVEKFEEKKEELKKSFIAKIFKKDEKIILSEVKFQILDKAGNFIPNLPITIHSEPQETITDENGIATFKDIPTGDHTLKFAYQNEDFQKRIAIAEPQTKGEIIQAEIIIIKAEKDALPIWAWGVIGGLIVALLIVIFYKRKKA